MKNFTTTTATSYLTICTGKEGAFPLGNNLIIFTPNVENTMSLFISESENDVLVTPQDDASDDLLSGLVEVTRKTAKFVFAKEELLNIVEENPETVVDLISLIKKHNIDQKELVALVGALQVNGNSSARTLPQLIKLSDRQLKQLIEYAQEMPALLKETYIQMISKY